jgi:DNA polymerase I-like protein with 3'-5' exonuclease and polymerase domains
MYNLIATLELYPQALEALNSEPLIGLDTETYIKPEYRALQGATALDPHTGRISLLILKSREYEPFIFDLITLGKLGYDRRPMYEFLSSREKLIGQNIQFDLKFLKREYGVVFQNAWDVRLMAKMIGNATGSKYARLLGYSLADLARDYLNIHLIGKDTDRVTDWYPRPLTEEKLLYAANDVNYLHDIHDILLESLVNPLPWSEIFPEGSQTGPYGLGFSNELIELEMFQSSVAAEMEYNGLPASREILEALQKSIKDEENETGELLQVTSELCKHLGLPTVPSFWSDSEIPTTQSSKTLNNPVKLKLLLNAKIGIEMSSAQAGVLERLIDLLEEQAAGEVNFVDEDEEELYRQILDYEDAVATSSSELCKLVLKYKQLTKQYSMNLAKYINPLTGCIHSGIDMLGAATSRSSARSPNLQNVPSRTYIQITRPDLENLYPSSANVDILRPDWSPFNDPYWRDPYRESLA